MRREEQNVLGSACEGPNGYDRPGVCNECSWSISLRSTPVVAAVLWSIGVGGCTCESTDPRVGAPPLNGRPQEEGAAEVDPESTTPDSRGRRRCDGSALEPLSLARVAGGLEQPLFVLSEPASAERLYVLEKGGVVKRIERGGQVAALLTLAVKTDVEMGLLGMAFHPQFGEDERRIYLSYVDPEGRSVVSAMELGEGHIRRDPEQILLRVEQPAPNHNGGMIAFGPDGFLYVGLGDGGGRNDQFGNGQDRTSPLGAILRLDVEEPARTIPGNLQGREIDPRIVHYGLRNPWRFSFDRATGDLFIADVGQDHWEEINVARASSSSTNFGWPTFEGTHRCPGCRTNVPEPSSDMRMPVHEYARGPAASVTGGYVYRGRSIPSLRGRYVYADFVQNWVRAFTWDGERACDHQELTPGIDPEGWLQGVASFGEDADGELYLVSFLRGEVLRMVPKIPD
jgi:glucose/arabinose dehydrogenase